MTKAIVLVGVVLSFLLIASSANADFIVQGGQVVSVSNTTGNTSQFRVGIAGGTGVCADTTLVFNEARAGNKDIFKRGFAVALTALSTGRMVRVWSYEGDSCFSPAYIEIR